MTPTTQKAAASAMNAATAHDQAQNPTYIGSKTRGRHYPPAPLPRPLIACDPPAPPVTGTPDRQDHPVTAGGLRGRACGDAAVPAGSGGARRAADAVMSTALEVDEARIPEHLRAAYRRVALGRRVVVLGGTARLACDDREDAVLLRDGLTDAGIPITAMRVVTS